MKKSHILATFAFAAILGLGVPTLIEATINQASAEGGQADLETSSDNTPSGEVTPTESETTETVTPTEDVEIATASAADFDDLEAALAGDKSEIIIEDTITITSDTPLDLQGKTLKLASGVYRMFAIQEGNVVIKNGTLSSNDDTTQTGNAILWVTGSDAEEGFANHTTLTVENDVKIITKNSYGLAVHYLSDKQLARGVVINFAGEIEAPYGISVNGNVQDTSNAPVINLTGKVASTAGDLAIFAAGYAEWNLNGATLTGATPLGAKAGKFTLENADLKATGSYQQISATGSGMNPNGSVIQIENSQPYAGEIEITVKSGLYESAHGPVFSEYGTVSAARTAGSNLKSLSISGGTFKSAEGMAIFENVATNETVITGGNFSNKDGLDAYLQSDQKLVEDENGNFVIQTVNTPVDPGTSGDKDDDKEDNKPATKPSDDKKPDSSSPNTGLLASIEHAANAVGAIGTTVITGVFVASGAALAWIIGSRRKATAKSGKVTTAAKTSKSSKNGRSFHLDRVEVEISAAPRAAAKSPRTAVSARSTAKSSRSASKSSRSASRVAAKSSAKSASASAKSAKAAKTSKKASSSAKSASSRKTAVSSRSSAKPAKKR